MDIYSIYIFAKLIRKVEIQTVAFLWFHVNKHKILTRTKVIHKNKGQVNQMISFLKGLKLVEDKSKFLILQILLCLYVEILIHGYFGLIPALYKWSPYWFPNITPPYLCETSAWHRVTSTLPAITCATHCQRDRLLIW